MATRFDVVSDVSGKVWQIPAPVGTAVSDGDPIVILESMKMEIPVETTRAGTVVEVRVAVEDTVEEGDVVAVLEG